MPLGAMGCTPVGELEEDTEQYDKEHEAEDNVKGGILQYVPPS